MDFPTWLEGQPRGTLKKLERKTDVGYTTLLRVKAAIGVSGDVARRVSEFTGAEVSIEELVCPSEHAKTKAAELAAKAKNGADHEPDSDDTAEAAEPREPAA